MPFCTHCGHAFTEGAKFCNACGRDLGPVATTTPKRPSRDDSVETSPQRGVGDIPNLIDLAGPGLFLPEIVGEASYQPALESIAGGKSEQGHEMEGEVSLIHDDKNPYDKQAIKVEIDGETVG